MAVIPCLLTTAHRRCIFRTVQFGLELDGVLQQDQIYFGTALWCTATRLAIPASC